ncbi:hypothetical protein BG000_007950 [Podila horticola]|nr:hypothetical protein BG000_007950 [Podila horticola]
MGKPLRPLCVATDQEYVYFVTTAVRYNNDGLDYGDILTALVRSERGPASLANTTWTLVSTFPAPMRQQHSWGVERCDAGLSNRYDLHD